MKRRLFWITIGLAVLAAGCGSKSESDGADAGSTAAVVNGHNIPVSDVQRVAQNFSRQGMEPDSTAQGDTHQERLYYTAVERLVEQELLREAAEKDGITVTDDEVQNNIAQLKSMAGGDSAFQKLLADNGATEEDVVKDMRTNLILKQYFDKKVDRNQDVTDQEIQDYFDSHPENFASKPQVKASHILIRTKPDMSDQDKAMALQKAEEVLAKAKKGEDFAALAKQYSEDPGSADRGGDLGWFSQGQMVAPFDSAAFALEPGQLSNVVTTNYGYHVIKLEDKRMGEPQKLETVKPQIHQFLAQQKSQAQFRALVDSLKTEAKIEITTPPPAGALDGIGS
jgi:peptidyl-prolyl cis-trans isomerase C